MEISTRRFKQLALIGLGATGILAACSSNSGSSGSTGGASAKGGSIGSGGASAQGGSTGSGGASAMGGSSATGGTAGSGGATSSGGACAGTVTLFDFATGDQGWVFNTYQATNAAGVAVSPFNLAVPGNLSGGDLDAGVAAPTLAADSTVGDPPGSLKVVVTFTGYDQQVNPNFNWGSNALQDWTNKVVSVLVKVDPAVPATFSGGIQLYAQDTTYAGQYQWSAFPTDNAWHTYTLDMTGTTSVNPAQIIQFTVQLASGSAPTDTGDGGVAPFTPTTVTAYIDTITVSGNAGSGGCGGGSTTPASGGAGGSNATASGGSGGNSIGGSGTGGLPTGGATGAGGAGTGTGLGGSNGSLPALTVNGTVLQDPSGKTIVLRGTALIDIGSLYAKGGNSAAGITARIDKIAAAGLQGHVIRLPVYPKINYNAGYPTCSPLPYPVGSGPSASCTPTTPMTAADYVSKVLQPAVDYATSKNLYAIIDFHQIDNATTGTSAADATTFWTDIAPKFASYTNVIYEPFNEPIDSSAPWTTLKPVVQGWINTIRAAAPNNIIIVPSMSYDQHPGDAASNPPTGTNLVFTAHVYPGNWSTSFQAQVATAVAKAPVFITEWGYELNGSDQNLSTTSATWGTDFETAVDGYGASWTAWVTDNSWTPSMFSDSALTTLTAFGTVVKNWLAAKATSDWVQ